MHRARSLLALLAVWGCDGADAPSEAAKTTPPTTTEAGAPGQPGKSASSHTSTTTDAAPSAAGAELILDGFYRAPKSRAVLHWSSPEAGQFVFEKDPKIKLGGGVIMAKGIAAQFRVTPKSPDGKGAIEAIAKRLSASGKGPSIDASTITSVAHPGGTEAWFASGRATQVLLVTDGDTTVSLLTVAGRLPAQRLTAESAGDDVILKLIHELQTGIKVGGKVPTLPDANPGTSLEGVWVQAGDKLGRYTAVTFAPGGYAHYGLPSSAAPLDPLAWFQGAGGVFGTYTFDGKALKVDWSDGDTFDFVVEKKTDDRLKVEGQRWAYERVDVARPGAALNGRFERSSFVQHSDALDEFTFRSSSWYSFTKDGRFETDGFVSASTRETAGGSAARSGAPTDGFGNRVSGVSLHKDGDKGRGTYSVVRDGIVLEFDGGGERRLSLYANVNEKGEWWMIYLGGRQLFGG